MKAFLQYNEDGNYTSEVLGDTAPEHPRQIELDPEKYAAAGVEINYMELSFENAKMALEPYK